MHKKLLIGVGIVAVLIAAIFIVGPMRIAYWVGYRVPEPTPIPADGSADFLTLPPTVGARAFAQGLEGPRAIAFDPRGRMVVSEMKAGRITRLDDTNRDGSAEARTVLMAGLTNPHGIAFYTNDAKKTFIYIAEERGVWRYPYDLATGSITNTAKREQIMSFPVGGRHVTRTIAFGPKLRKNEIVSGPGAPKLSGFLSETKLYATVGSSCDVCVEEATWKYGSLLEADPEGTYTAEFAGGLRNTVFFTFHPITKEIWGTDMGRDNLGDDLPPDEVNIIRSEQSYGWPFCYGDRVRDTKFNPGRFSRTDIQTDCAKTIPAAIELPAHSAPLGIAFVPAKGWGSLGGQLLVAYHGSWNRSTPTGYKVVRFAVDAKGNVSDSGDFITGWLRDGKLFGRPVDLKFGPDGALYISDDAAGAIWRVAPQS
ncbi:MAG: PQQ-dependent sugar dehydrogenase [Candidatus Paceibacterota bacterium]|nr:MAG: PQQ-dependent sugar dehydrogenase [Candidatus Paceibacterota bacterium]